MTAPGSTNTQIVLVPGFWLGADAWDDVVPRLEERGHTVTALTLPGRRAGDADSAHGARTTPQDQADAIISALDPQAQRRVLVVHSGAALPGTLVIDQRPDLVDHVVWVDTAPTQNGQAMDETFSGDWLLLEDTWEDELAQGSMRGLSEEQLEAFRRRAVPEPGGVVRTPLELRDDERLAVPGTVVCTTFPAEQFREYAAQGVPFLAALTEHTALEYVDLPTGHWPMWSRPAELAEVIDAAASSAGAQP